MSVDSSSHDAGALIRPVPLRKQQLADRSCVARRALGPALLLVLWAAASLLGWTRPTVLPSPLTLVDTLVMLWREQALAHQIGVSLLRALSGGFLGILAGLLLGLAAGLSRLGEELFDAALQMLRMVPFLALVPLFIVWFGIGEGPKLLLIALATVFPMYLNTYTGVRNVDRKVIEAMQTFGLTGPSLLYEAVIPLALPSILTGLRYSLGISVLVLIAAEQINASAGLGYLLNNAQLYQQVDVIMICIVIYALLGLLADMFVRLLERVLMPWRAGIAAR
jgi:sulfonate transport system permease protein